MEIFNTLMPAKCRKYDIEAEAKKLYGEDLNSVLLRFRKTPEYLDILEDKINDMKEQLRELIVQIQSHYIEELEDRLAEDLGASEELKKQLRSGSQLLGSRHKSLRDQRAPVEDLDTYSKLHPHLSTSDLNHYKDLGFEYAGRVIHTVIQHMGPEEPKSTMQPAGGQEVGKTKPTTKHDHQVTSSTEAAATSLDIGSQPAGY